MLRAKRKHGSYPAIFRSYRSRIFKFASRNFYSEFMAAQTIAKDYQTYFGDLVLDKPNPTRSIGLDGYVAFNDVCDHFGISAKELKTLNPALRTPVFNGQKYIPKGYNLRLPTSLALSADASISYDSLPESLYHEKQKPSRFYTVQRGDTAGKIARLHGVPLSDLILANNLNHRATIYRHQTLRIPVPGETIKTGPAPLTLASAPATKASTKAQVAPAAHTEKEIPEKEQYPKPVLASIIPPPEPDAKAEAETKAVDTPEDVEPSLEIVTADVQFENLIQADELPMGILSVEVEETLGHYAEWADVRTWKIRRLNNLSYGDTLHLHQKVKIPLSKKTAEDFVQRRYEYHKRLQEDFFAVYRIGELQSYTVRRGDNYWTLCRDKFDVPLWLLKHCNPETDLANLRFNQKLTFPIIEKASENDPSSIPDVEPGEEVDDQSPDPSDSLDVLALKNTRVQRYP
jgi:membrane-bound lytic murein transglycosylase D